MQDLHGYSNPWPAGGGINIIPTGTDTSNGFITNRTIDASGSVDLVTLGYDVSEYFEITAGETYSLCIYPAIIGAGIGFAFYDSNKQYLSGVDLGANATGICTLTADSGAVYCRATKSKDGNTYQTLLCRGSTRPTAWTPYSNICPISGHTGAEIEQTGVNIWDEEWEVGSYSSTGQKVPTQGGRIRSVNKIAVLPNIAYYGLKGVHIICQYDKNEDFVSFTQLGTDSPSNVGHLFTTGANTYYITFATYVNYGTTYSHDISINYPATDTEYHPYTGNQISVDWEDEAGTVYGGTVTLNEDGSADVAPNMAKIVFDGTQAVSNVNWRPNESSVGWLYSASLTPGIKLNTGVSIIPNIVSDVLQTVSYDGVYNGTTDCISVVANSSTLGIAMRSTDTSLTTQTAINAYLTQHPVEVIYELATPESPIHIPNVGSLSTYLGTNNIWADTGDVTVTYIAKSAKFSFGSPLRIYNYNNLKLFGNTYIEHGKG